MTQTLSSLDLVPTLPAKVSGSLSLTGGAGPTAALGGPTVSGACDVDWLKNPALARRLVELAERAGLLPAPAARSAAQQRTAMAPGPSLESVVKLQKLANPRQRAVLEKLAVWDGLLPKPGYTHDPSPLGPNAVAPSAPATRGTSRGSHPQTAAQELARTLLTKKVARLAQAAPGAAARALTDRQYEAELVGYAATEGKLVFIPEAGPRLLLLPTPERTERAAAQARLDRQQLEETIFRLELTPWPGASSPPPTAAYLPIRFNAYGVERLDDANAFYRWQEREGAAGLFDALSLSFVDAGKKGVFTSAGQREREALNRAETAQQLRGLFATYNVLARLVPRDATKRGRRRMAHNPVELYVDTPSVRAKFAAEDLAAARQTMLRLNLDAAGLRQPPRERPMLGFAQLI